MNQVIKYDFYEVNIEHNVIHVPFNYRNLTFIASGVYGKVYQATNIIDPSERLVIKQLCSPFSHPILAKRAYREIYLLRHLRHENIIELRDLFTPNIAVTDFQQLYIVSGYAGRNLRTMLENREFTDPEICYLVHQMLRGLRYIHSAGIIHRDLKPDNMAVSENNLQLKILDFGLARHVSDEMTGYVATRYYRSPEIMFNWRHYTQKADIWSIGCIMGELYHRQPLFMGRNMIEMVERIVNICGTPDQTLIHRITSNDARIFITNGLSNRPRANFQQLFPNASQTSIDFLSSALNMDADIRPTAAQALEHIYFNPYRRQLHVLEDESRIQVDEDIEKDLTIEEWQQKIWDEINIYRTERMNNLQNNLSFLI